MKKQLNGLVAEKVQIVHFSGLVVASLHTPTISHEPANVDYLFNTTQ